MLSKIRLDNRKGEYIEAHVGPPSSSGGYFVKSVDGLGPAKADIGSTKWALLAGGAINSSSVGFRNIVAYFGFQPNYAANQTVESLRRELYRIANPGDDVRVWLYNDGVAEMWIDGVVESNDPSIFSSEPEIQISIMCSSPFLRKNGIDSVVSETGANIDIDYIGSVPWGVELILTAAVNVNYVQIQDRSARYDTDERPTVRVAHPISAGEKIRLITNPGTKLAEHRNSSGNLIERVTGKIQVTNDWVKTHPGMNRYFVSQGVSTRSPVELNYRVMYGGF